MTKISNRIHRGALISGALPLACLLLCLPAWPQAAPAADQPAIAVTGLVDTEDRMLAPPPVSGEGAVAVPTSLNVHTAGSTAVIRPVLLIVMVFGGVGSMPGAPTVPLLFGSTITV